MISNIDFDTLENVKFCESCNHNNCVIKKIWGERLIKGCFKRIRLNNEQVNYCPFCGGTVYAYEIPEAFSDIEIEYTGSVCCKDCGVSISKQTWGFPGVAVKKAIGTWNRRHYACKPYDVEAVVRELERKSTFFAHEAEGDKDMGYEYLTIRKYGISDGLDIAIEIVRGGRND